MRLSAVCNIFFIYLLWSDNVKVQRGVLHQIMELLSQAETINVLTNFGDGRPVYGVESLMEHYVVLSEDPRGDLPVEFSICSSVLIQYVTTNQYFYQLYNVSLSASISKV